MRRLQPDKSGYRALVLLAGLFAAVGILALTIPATSKFHDAALVLWGAIPVSVALWDFAYHHIERHRLLVNRARFRITNPESNWGMTAEFDVDRPLPHALEAADATMKALLNRGDLCLSQGGGRSVWQISGMTIRVISDVASDPTGDTNVVRVEFPPARRSYRSWRPVIEDTVTIVVGRIEMALTPSAKKFVVQVGFPTDNPYFGLFVTDVGAQSVTRFDLDYFETRFHEKDVVRVKKDRMELVTETMLAARNLSLHYLALNEVL